MGQDIHRIRYAFPVFRPNYGEILWALYNDPSIRGPLFLAGDYMVYPTLGGAAARGINAVELIEEYA